MALIPWIGRGSISLLLTNLLSFGLRQTTKTRRPLKQGLRLFVCMRFQDLFHSPPGVLFAFPSRYWFTIGRLRVFSLGGWSPHLQTGFHVSRPTSLTLGSTTLFSHTGLSPNYGRTFQTVLLTRWLNREGFSGFARHYFRNLG